MLLAVRLNVIGVCGGDPKISVTLSNGHLHAAKIGCEEAGALIEASQEQSRQPFIDAARDSTLGRSGDLSEFGNSMGPTGNVAHWLLWLGVRWVAMLESFPARIGHHATKGVATACY
jgi:hypothetical protein